MRIDDGSETVLADVAGPVAEGADFDGLRILKPPTTVSTTPEHATAAGATGFRQTRRVLEGRVPREGHRYAKATMTMIAVVLALTLSGCHGGAVFLGFGSTGFKTYLPAVCTIKIRGFEHWGKAAASVRDENQSCWEIQPKVKYKDSNNNFKWKKELPVISRYKRVVAGTSTDWDQAHGRSPNLSLTWYWIQR